MAMNSFYKHMAAFLSAAIIFVSTAAAYSRNSVYRDEVTLWADAVKKSPEKKRTHIVYGSVLTDAGLYDRAQMALEKALLLKEGHVFRFSDLQTKLGILYFKTGRNDDAITAWLKGLIYEPKSHEILNGLSLAMLEKKRYSEALEYAKRAVAAQPLSPQPINTLGEIYLAIENFEKANEYFLKAIDIDPDTPLRYWNAALSFEGLGRFDKAIEFFGIYASMEKDEKERGEAIRLMEVIRERAGVNSGKGSKM